jgi:transcriptional regulator with XRE-family HTH domain
MGTNRRPTPARLAGKLLEIRKRLGLTQDELVERLGLEKEFDQERISKFERGKLEPPLHVLCAYADVANIVLDVLARDDLSLPSEIPTRSKVSSIPRQYAEAAKDKPIKSRKGQ